MKHYLGLYNTEHSGKAGSESARERVGTWMSRIEPRPEDYQRSKWRPRRRWGRSWGGIILFLKTSKGSCQLKSQNT